MLYYAAGIWLRQVGVFFDRRKYYVKFFMFIYTMEPFIKIKIIHITITKY